MPEDIADELAEIDTRIADIRENLRELVEQAAAQSGAADEALAAQRISDQEAELERLTRQRDALAKRKG
jgi:predicted RNA-binding protein